MKCAFYRLFSIRPLGAAAGASFNGHHSAAQLNLGFNANNANDATNQRHTNNIR